MVSYSDRGGLGTQRDPTYRPLTKPGGTVLCQKLFSACPKIHFNSVPPANTVIFISTGCPPRPGAYIQCMNHERMYELATVLHELHHRYLLDRFVSFHSYRYKFFVDSSPRGRHCRYGKACLKLYWMDNEAQELLKFLESLEPIPPRLPRLRELLNENQDH